MQGNSWIPLNREHNIDALLLAIKVELRKEGKEVADVVVGLLSIETSEIEGDGLGLRFGGSGLQLQLQCLHRLRLARESSGLLSRLLCFQ